MKKLVTQTEKRGRDGSDRREGEMGWRGSTWDLGLRAWVDGKGEMDQRGSAAWGKGVRPVRSGRRKKKKEREKDDESAVVSFGGGGERMMNRWQR